MKTQGFPRERVTPESPRPAAPAEAAAPQRLAVTIADDRESMYETLEYLIAAGPVVATLPPRASMWSPEKRLAGAILASALVELRDHHGDRSHRNLVVENLRWITTDDTAWPFSFIRLCQLFDLEPSWVRAQVARWMSPQSPASNQAPLSGHGANQQAGRACAQHRRKRTAGARRALHAAIA